MIFRFLPYEGKRPFCASIRVWHVFPILMPVSNSKFRRSVQHISRYQPLQGELGTNCKFKFFLMTPLQMQNLVIYSILLKQCLFHLIQNYLKHVSCLKPWEPCTQSEICVGLTTLVCYCHLLASLYAAHKTYKRDVFLKSRSKTLA